MRMSLDVRALIAPWPAARIQRSIRCGELRVIGWGGLAVKSVELQSKLNGLHTQILSLRGPPRLFEVTVHMTDK